MTREEAIWWVNHLFEIRKEEYFNKRMMEDAKEVEEAQCMAIEALKQEPIVRCKDCIHEGREKYPLPDGRQIVFCRKYRKERFAISDGYCECGERVKE